MFTEKISVERQLLQVDTLSLIYEVHILEVLK